MHSKLEFQADRIEAVLHMHRVPARVTGGTVTPRRVRFQVLPALGAKVSKVKALSEELAAALDTSDCRISRRGAAIDVEIARDDPHLVRLIPLLRRLEGEVVPPGTAVLGLADEGAPLLIRLPSPDVAHVLVAGTTGSGKTALLQTMIVSLVIMNRPDAVSLVLLDPKGSGFGVFDRLPHLARPLIRQVEEVEEAMHSLVRLMERRGDRGTGGRPHLVVVIDELADVLMTGGRGVQEPLTRLLQRGREAGIHIVGATQKPTASVLGSLVQANFPVRLVGRVASASDARVASGWSGTGAERLEGRGDFVAVAEGRVRRFQVAFVTRGEIRDLVQSRVDELRESPKRRPS